MTTGAQTGLKFEVAVIKPPAPELSNRGASTVVCRGTDTRNVNSVPLGRCIANHTNLQNMILSAFPPSEPLVTADNVTTGTSTWARDVSARIRIMSPDKWVIGGPGWLTSEFYEMEAKAEDPSTANQDQLREMLRNFVIEKFKLSFHMESREISGYALVPAKGGPHLKEVDPGVRPSVPSPEVKRFPMQQGNLVGFAMILSNQMKAPVIDTTNIAGTFDFSSMNGVDFGASTTVDGDTPNGTVFSAIQDHLGLKLEPRKIPVQVFVVDHAEKPGP